MRTQSIFRMSYRRACRMGSQLLVQRAGVRPDDSRRTLASSTSSSPGIWSASATTTFSRNSFLPLSDRRSVLSSIAAVREMMKALVGKMSRGLRWKRARPGRQLGPVIYKEAPGVSVPCQLGRLSAFSRLSSLNLAQGQEMVRGQSKGQPRGRRPVAPAAKTTTVGTDEITKEDDGDRRRPICALLSRADQQPRSNVSASRRPAEKVGLL